ncbi:hypothetical protein NAPIS_ORF02179 [Vairimorpha apis BRL 01]|uniref:Uncharacterized protein n=1 Tax=Vairimorpha apis BRL 01 TaxID=1037528 RepID=T0MA63_9MICR|nr:hypothetical protein NAPIS_ORF02179 [Vairimorpha apis BRL 01]
MKIIIWLYFMYCTSASISKNDKISHQSNETKTNDNTKIAVKNFNDKKLENNFIDKNKNEELLMSSYLIKLSTNITDEKNYYIDTFHNIQNIVELCNIEINNNINELIISKAFMFLFNLLVHDIKNALSGLKFLNLENEDITKIILKFDKCQPNYQCNIPIFIKALQELLNLDFKIDHYLNYKKCEYLNFNLFSFIKM